MCISVPMQIVEVETMPNAPPLARACYEGVVKNVSLAMLPDVKVGDYVLVQFGLATSRLEPEEAQQTLQLLRELDKIFTEVGDSPAISLDPEGPKPYGPADRGP